ncbi:hypothetical protein SEA_GOBY_46 [Streptomyces phage Goby]|uniref:Uncharacterized protein n=1 Tax=Streptomyces phage Goby TaxID=2182319 RepID=A0A2U8UTU4_9CAUD|nr:hypothetical protein KGH00_gp46 [Streptomyces phage Goby]ATE85151.1 hypothetical protein SEA_DATTRAN_48 [Streptomyces phage Dattran]AWN07564.1 hypothetical protein SEA_GOBY_46 [Streptomyces phage Goby]AWN07640.1 hypothetical protein SEA_TOMA_46 [Streptomyces phage Toma]
MTTPSPIPAGQTDFYDDASQVYYWFNQDDGQVYSRPYSVKEIEGTYVRQALNGLHSQADEAMVYLDERIDKSLLYLENLEPTPEQLYEQVKVLSDLAAYSAGTLKRLIVVLGELTKRPVDMVV